MIIAYPLTNTLDYRELMYSLRSIEKYLPNLEVVIVGEQVPGWLTNVTWIKVKDTRGRKQLSIKTKIMAALEYSRQVFFMNDDIFILREIDNPNKFPYYFSGQLKDQTEGGTKILSDQLRVFNLPEKHFDIHAPIFYTKDFRFIVEKFSDDTVIKSMYCNFCEIEGEYLQDLKIVQPMAVELIRNLIKDRPCFSTGSTGLKSALIVLEELFPNKSKFEL